MPTKNTGIALANELAKVAQDAMMDDEVTTLGVMLMQTVGNEWNEDLASILFKYTATLTANVSSRITHTLLTQTQISEMISDIEMFDEIEKDVLGN